MKFLTAVVGTSFYQQSRNSFWRHTLSCRTCVYSSERRKLHFPRSPVEHVCTVVRGENYISHALAFHMELCAQCKCLCSKSWVLFCVIDTSVRRDLHHLCPLVCQWRVTSHMNAASTSRMKMVQMDQGKSMKQTHVKGMLVVMLLLMFSLYAKNFTCAHTEHNG